MTKSPRFHLDELPDADRLPKHLSKQEFGRRLANFLDKKTGTSLIWLGTQTCHGIRFRLTSVAKCCRHPKAYA